MKTLLIAASLAALANCHHNTDTVENKPGAPVHTVPDTGSGVVLLAMAAGTIFLFRKRI